MQPFICLIDIQVKVRKAATEAGPADQCCCDLYLPALAEPAEPWHGVRGHVHTAFQ